MTADSEPQRTVSGGFFLHVAPAILYVLAIFYAGSVSQGPELHVGFMAPDKLLHALAFFGMQLTLFRAVRWKRGDVSTARLALVAFLISAAIGALLELWQATLPHRSPELLDWLADLVGAGAAALLLRLVYGRAAPA